MKSHKLSVLLIGAVAAKAAGALRSRAAGARAESFHSPAEALASLELLGEAEARTRYDAVVIDESLLDALPYLNVAMPTAAIVAIVGYDDAGGAAARAEGADVAIAATLEFELHVADYVRFAVERRRMQERIDSHHAAIAEITSRDELTGLANRKRFAAALDYEIERANRFHRPVTLLHVALDGLKLLNDTHGTAAGDAALGHVARTLRAEVRRFELVARVGDGEFAVVLVDTNFDEGRQTAERLRRAVAATPVSPAGAVTVSIGVASLPTHAATEAELVRAATHALAEARGGGRDRIVLSRATGRIRDGERHAARFRVIVSGRDSRGELFTEDAETELVSRRGAQIVASRSVAAGERIELHSPFHLDALEARVTSCYRGGDGRWRIGFKLLDPTRWSA